MFHSILVTWFLVTKLQKYEILPNLCLHFAGQDGQDGKKPESDQNTQNQKMEIWDEQNIDLVKKCLFSLD